VIARADSGIPQARGSGRAAMTSTGPLGSRSSRRATPWRSRRSGSRRRASSNAICSTSSRSMSDAAHGRIRVRAAVSRSRGRARAAHRPHGVARRNDRGRGVPRERVIEKSFDLDERLAAIAKVAPVW